MKTRQFFHKANLVVLALLITSAAWSANIKDAVNNEHSKTTLLNLYNPNGTSDQLQGNLMNLKLQENSPILTNFPDPFISKTSVIYQLSQATFVELKVYHGSQLVAVLVSEYKPSGKHSVIFDSEGLPAGNYVAVLVTNFGSFIESMTKKSLAEEKEIIGID